MRFDIFSSVSFSWLVMRILVFCNLQKVIHKLQLLKKKKKKKKSWEKKKERRTEQNRIENKIKGLLKLPMHHQPLDCNIFLFFSFGNFCLSFVSKLSAISISSMGKSLLMEKEKKWKKKKQMNKKKFIHLVVSIISFCLFSFTLLPSGGRGLEREGTTI